MDYWAELKQLALDLIELDDEVVREMMNGTWFILTFEILLALIYYIIWRAVKEPSEPRYVWVVPTRWYRELGTQLAVSWAVFCAGSVIRSGWIYVWLECVNRLGHKSCEPIPTSVWWLHLASFLAIVGGVCTIRVMLPAATRPWSYVLPATIAVSVPILVRVLR